MNKFLLPLLLVFGLATVAFTQGNRDYVSSPAALRASKAAVATPILKAALSTTVFTVSSHAANLDSYFCFNADTVPNYVQFFDTAASVTLGTTVPKWSIGIPAGGAANLSSINLGYGSGIKVAATTTATGSSAPATAVDCNFGIR